MTTRFGKVLQNIAKLPQEQPSEPLKETEPVLITEKKMGRPPGKKSNPEYSQVTVYLRKDVHRAAKKILVDEGREFSELVDDLVGNWTQTFKLPEV